MDLNKVLKSSRFNWWATMFFLAHGIPVCVYFVRTWFEFFVLFWSLWALVTNHWQMYMTALIAERQAREKKKP